MNAKSRSTRANVRAGGSQADRLRRLASYAGVGLAVAMFIAKTVAWLVTGSVMLLTSLADAGIDLVGAFTTLLAVDYARRPPDRAHRFGHGKGEALSALLQVVFLAGAAVTVIGEAAQRFLVPHPLAKLGTGLVVVAASLAATLA